MSQRILITGAAGKIGSLMRYRLARPNRVLRLLDIAAMPDPATGEQSELIRASVTDLTAMEHACQDADAVIHLAGLSIEAPWEHILPANIHGTYTVLEAARRQGVPRIVFASSNHAVGFHPRSQEAGDYLFPRPDSYYGVSKAAGEALASLYHDRYGLNVICVRIGSCEPRPQTTRMLATWLSPDDAARLFEACLAAPNPGFRVVWGISANTRRWFSLREAQSLGYEPRDDAEMYAAELISRYGEPNLSQPDHRLVGGDFCTPNPSVNQ